VVMTVIVQCPSAAARAGLRPACGRQRARGALVLSRVEHTRVGGAADCVRYVVYQCFGNTLAAARREERPARSGTAAETLLSTLTHEGCKGRSARGRSRDTLVGHE
jgi:hypothetical protein